MASSNSTEFNLPKDVYASFDAVSLKRLINDRLSQDSVFTDQVFEGSNLASVIDIIAYMYHVLIFYLNNTSSESYFSQAEIYENMNKIVNLLGYNPLGPQTSLLSFSTSATSDISTGPYTIKRYSYFNIGNITYSFTQDSSFEKSTTGIESLVDFSSRYLLAQGIYKEYPLYNAIGEEFEIVTITDENLIDPVTESFVADYIDVYVRDATTGKWNEWSEVGSLYLEKATAKAYEKRLNDQGRYEIKFGNDVTGKRLNVGDQVAIYYLQSQGDRGRVGPGAINNTTLTLFNTVQFRSISTDIFDEDQTYIGPNDVTYLLFSNSEQSTKTSSFETVDEIRQNAPKIFTAQNRAVTTGDYEIIIRRNFNDIVSSVSVVNNNEYVNEYLNYLYGIGLDKPNDDYQILTNQVNFSDACDFNNVYVFIVPKLGAIIGETEPGALNVSQKQLIVNEVGRYKLISNDIIPVDPQYVAFDVGLPLSTETLEVGIRETTELRITRDIDSKLSTEQIIDLVYQQFLSFFNIGNNDLGQLLNVTQLNNNIISTEGVESVETVRVIDGSDVVSIPGVGLLYWNARYENADIESTFQNIQLPFYKFPFLYDQTNFRNRIKIIT